MNPAAPVTRIFILVVIGKNKGCSGLKFRATQPDPIRCPLKNSAFPLRRLMEKILRKLSKHLQVNGVESRMQTVANPGSLVFLESLPPV